MISGDLRSECDNGLLSNCGLQQRDWQYQHDRVLLMAQWCGRDEKKCHLGRTSMLKTILSLPLSALWKSNPLGADPADGYKMLLIVIIVYIFYPSNPYLS